jgi:hypothetical protein
MQIKIREEVGKMHGKGRGVFRICDIGALARAILKNRLLAPAIFDHFSAVGKNCGC